MPKAFYGNMARAKYGEDCLMEMAVNALDQLRQALPRLGI
jgi:hypothetical protein